MQSAVQTANLASGEKAVLGSSAPPGKAPAPASAEMRLAFESMMGSLLGTLSTGQQMAVIPLPQNGEPASNGLAGTLHPIDNPSLESLYALLNGKMGQTGQPISLSGSAQDAAASTLTALSNGEPSSQPLTAEQLAAPTAMKQPVESFTQLDKKSVETADTPAVQTQSITALAVAQQTAGGLGDGLADGTGQESSDQTPATAHNGGQNLVSGFALGTQSANAPTTAVSGSKGGPPIAATPTEQVGEQIQVSLSRGENDATIQLHPKELGSVRIRLQMENGQLHLSIRAEQQETGRMLNGRLADLRQSLEGQGIKVGELAVARSERSLGSEAASQVVAPTFRSGQMDMNSNGSHPQRQQMAFAGGDFGEGGLGGGQTAQRQVDDSGLGAGVQRPPGETRSVRSTARGAAAVDYYA